MHSTKRTPTTRIGLGALLIGALVFANTAKAADHGHRRNRARHDTRTDRNESEHEVRRDSRRVEARADLHDAPHIGRRLYRRGRAIDRHFDFLALVAAASGE
ncbi:MAG: hypothetical protein GY910_04850 [bacterium]|nr:hypothetical protein [bacterium]